MIIVCPKCETKFNFDEEKMETGGIWCRCCRCQKVFFYKKPLPSTLFEEPLPAAEVEVASYHNAVPLENDMVGDGEEPAGEPVQASEPRRTEAEHDAPHVPGKVRNLWTPGKITAYVIVLVLVLTGVYLSIFPEVGLHLLGKTPLGAYFGIQVPGNPAASGVELLNVRERFVENRMVGTVMVIEGFAVNKNDHPVSRLKVKAKLVDTAGEFTAESEAFCGVLLGDEELTNLTEREIRSELDRAQGRNIPNANILPEGTIPFMIVFSNAPQRTTEYIVELAGLEKTLK